ncbi:unnamed protein product [Acanthoscelides obtectus]|uniref:Glycosyl transferase family 25 domain-containing protein n=1 Tax=Acanthoscelides obtectus TaxID=200917 RepID=A0A9P0P6B2_ACAOB|nr:unnamed protein product [Acanthoscelides obtectus]CAK1669325.1 Glycosyltransferase 25 family member [Acanthoscelides obtectus]
MKYLLAFLFILSTVPTFSKADFKQPTILISILARNKAHTLPYFLSNLERQNYPKDRISLWIRSDHNSDNTIDILKVWISSVKHKYHSVNTEFIDDEKSYPDEMGPGHWTPQRFKQIIYLREAALEHGRKIWADYLLAIDCDVFLTNPDTLPYLVSRNYTVVAPMLKSEALYSNFWYGMTEDYYYQRTDEYKLVLHRETVGCYSVPMIHSCVLIDLRKEESDFLTYDPNNIKNFEGPTDDIISFAVSANRSGFELKLCNEEEFGYIMIPLDEDNSIELDYERLVNTKMAVLHEYEPLFVNSILKPYVRPLPKKDTLVFDKIYMINLKRRHERRKRMLTCFDELGLEVDLVDAVDGQALNESFLGKILFLPGFEDPYHKRPMKLGEIGCFLSHYNIWRDVVHNKYSSVLILEDDIRFEPFFRTRVKALMNEVNKMPSWDLVYYGRKILQDDEKWVDGTNYLVEAGYSYWTLGYVLNYNGANKLLDADPLSRLVPVDEYLPILFDKHPQVNYL